MYYSMRHMSSKALENLTFVLKQSYSVECFYCHHYLLSGCHEEQRLCRTNYIYFNILMCLKK